MAQKKKWKRIMAFLLAVTLMAQITESNTLFSKAEEPVVDVLDSKESAVEEKTEETESEEEKSEETESEEEKSEETESEEEKSEETESEEEKTEEAESEEEKTEEESAEDSDQVMRLENSSSMVSIKGTISYADEGVWKDMIRPKTFAGEIQLNAYDNDGILLENYEAVTTPGSQFYLEFVHDGSGGGTYTITNVPTSITVDSQTKEVSRYEVLIPSDDVYDKSENNTVNIYESEGKIAFINVDLIRKPKTVQIAVSKVLPGETEASFGMTLSASNGERSASTNISVKAGSTTTIKVPVNITYTLKETDKEGYSLVGYRIEGGELEQEQSCQIPVKDSDIAVTVVNASYNSKEKWTVKWVDNHRISSRPVPEFQLQYKIENGEFRTITEEDIALLGLSKVPEPRKEMSDMVQQDTEYYSFEGLPSVTTEGQSITYRVEADDITTGSNKYMAQWDEAHKTVILTYAEPFSVTVKWADAATGEKRPDIEQIRKLYHLYRYTDQNYTEISLGKKMNISDNGDATWTISYDGLLPRYTQENESLTYVLVQGTIDNSGVVSAESILDKNGDTGTYQTTYNNGNGSFANETDRCYNGQTIIQTLTGTTNCTVTKIWKDQNGDKRPSATVTLWRYSMIGENDTAIDMARSARVIIPGVSGDVLMSYSLATSGVDCNGVNKTETIDFLEHFKNRIPSGYQFPKYDELGREYQYFVQENVLENADAAQYQTVYQTPQAGEINGAYDGGNIINTKVDKLAIKVNKKWNAASGLTDLEGKEITFVLVGKKSGTEEIVEIPVLEGNNCISGFGSEQTTGSTEFLVNPYDENGQPYEILGIREKEITGIKEGSLSIDKDEQTKVTFQIGENSYVGICSTRKEGNSSLYDTKQYTYQVTNTINRKKDYTIIKKWGAGVTPQDLTFQLKATSINPANTGTKIYTADFQTEGQKVTLSMDGKIHELVYTESKQGNYTVWNVKFEELFQMYDEEGYLINYYVTEEQPGNRTWTHTDYSRADNSTTVTNYKGTDKPVYYMYVNKVWKDDGDAANRQDVLVQICDKDGNAITGAEGKGSYQVTLNQKNLWEATVQVPDNPATAGYIVKEVKVGEAEVTESDGKETVATGTCRYEVTYHRNSANSVTITNTRTGKVDVEITKNWVDGDNRENTRPSSVSFIIKNQDTGISVREASLNADSNAVSGNLNQWKIRITDLEKYDTDGKLISYVIEEKQDKTTTKDYEYQMISSGVSYHAVADAEKTTILYECTNVLKGETVFTVHKRWNDKATQGKTRPDLYLALHQIDTETGIDSVYTDYKNQKWEAGADSAAYNWKIMIEKLPAYNEDGYPYEYYVVENMNDNGSSTGLSYQAVYCKSLDGGKGPDMSQPNRDADGNLLERAYNGDYIVNTLSASMTVDGEKIWKNTDGYAVEELPNLTIRLKRRLESEAPSEATEVASLILDGQGKSGGEKNYGDISKTKFFFAADEQGNPLPQYDENGERYIYTLEEVIPEASSFLYKKENRNNSLVNAFNISDNKRSISVTKYWDRSKIPTDARENEFPAVTLNLYRYKKPTDGKTLTADEKKSGGILQSITINAADFEKNSKNDGSVTVTFDDLLIFSPNGSKYCYYIEESPVAGYVTYYYQSKNATGQGSLDGIDVIDEMTLETPEKKTEVSLKNCYDENAYQTISLSGVKVWDDYKDFFKYRPAEITVTLFRYTGNQSGQNNRVENVQIDLATEATTDGTPYITWEKTNKTNGAGKDIWNYTIYNLRRYAPNGETYVYKLVEQQDVDDYYGKANEINKNNQDDAKGDITMKDCTNAFASSCYVRKNWIDGDNKYGFRPESITVVLQRSVDGTNWENVPNPYHVEGDDKPVYMQVVLTKSNAIPNTNESSWQYTFNNLPKYQKLQNGETMKKEYQYRCIETKIGEIQVDDVAATIDVANKKNIGSYTRTYEFGINKTVITNSMNGTSLGVTKEWEDVDNLYQTRPEKIQFYLQKTTATPNEISNGSAIWTNAKDTSGKDIILTLSSSDADRSDNNKWVKTFDSLPVSENGTTLTLYYRAVEFTDCAENGKKYPKLQGDIVYRNYEVMQDGSEAGSWNYNQAVSKNESTIKNSLIVSESISAISVEKIWRNDTDSPAYDVTFELQKKEGTGSWTSFSPAVVKVISQNDAASKVTFEHLPAVNAKGETVSYQIIEKTTNRGYRSIFSEPTTDAGTKTKSYICTNVQLMDFTVSKVWKENQNGLLQNGAKGYVAEGILQQKIGDNGVWSNAKDADGKNLAFSIEGNASKKFTGLPRYTETNERIFYRAIETRANGVQVADENGNALSDMGKSYQITYNHGDVRTEITNTLVTVPIQITKVWDDDNNHDAVRPDDIALTLYADYDGSGPAKREEVSTSKYTISWDKLMNSNQWEASITGLPRYAADGKTEIEYSLEEILSGEAGNRYFTTITDKKPEDSNGSWSFTITNTLNLQILLQKQDQTDNGKLAGVEFRLYQLVESDGNYERKTGDSGKLYTTDGNGNLQILIEKTGVYELEETKAAKGYITPGKEDGTNALVIRFTVQDKDLRQTLDMGIGTASFFALPQEYMGLLTVDGLVNERKQGTLKVYKKDGDTDTPLDDVTFTLYRKTDGNTFENIWNFLTGKTYQVYAQTGESTSGVTVINGLDWGEYKLVETATLDGYKLTGDEYAFNVNADTVDSPIELTASTDAASLQSGNVITNYRNKLQFSKQSSDATPVPLSGGTYRILRVTQENGNRVRTEVSFDTDASGKGGKKNRLTAGDCIYGLPVGTYELEELTAPAGYLKNITPVVFRIDAYGVITGDNGKWEDNKVVMQDKPATLAIKKIDIDSKLSLTGAEFSVTGIFAQNGVRDNSGEKTINDITTDNAERVLRGKLIVSTGETEGVDLFLYQLSETKTPSGYSPLVQPVTFKITEHGLVLLQAPTLVSVENGGETPVLMVGNTKNFCSFTIIKEFKEDEKWKESIRPSKIAVQLYTQIEGQDGTKTAIGQPFVFEITKDRDVYTHTFEHLPTHFYREENGGIVSEKLCYFVEETSAEPENLSVYYTAKYSQVIQNGSNYSQTVINTAEQLYNPGFLKISKTNSGGAQAAEFQIKVTLKYHGKETIFKDSYEVYDTEDRFLRTVRASAGYVVIKGGEYALLELPQNVEYQIEEKLETVGTTTQYEPVYSNPSGRIKEGVVTEAAIVNKAKIYTAIENRTENKGINQQNQTNAGGIVGIVTEGHNPETYDKVDYQEGRLTVYWMPEADWQYMDSFTVTYREYDGSTEGGREHQIIVTGFLNENGKPKDISDSCYQELKSRYPDMTISQNEDGAIILRLSNKVDGMPYLNKVDVTFLPTIAVINTTAGNVGGQVKAETGNFQEIADGKGLQGEKRYAQTRVYAKAEPGYMIDLSGLEIGNVDAIEVQKTDEPTVATFAAMKTMGQKEPLTLDKGRSFNVCLPYTIAGETDEYAISGSVEVVQSGTNGYPSEIVITLKELSMPVDIGILFVKAPKIKPVEEDNEEEHTPENIEDKDEIHTLGNVEDKNGSHIWNYMGNENCAEESKGIGISEKREGPNTGDDTHLFFWILLLCLSGGIAIMSMRRPRKKKGEEKSQKHE